MAASNDGANLGATNYVFEVEIRAYQREIFSSLTVTHPPALFVSRHLSAETSEFEDLGEKVDIERLIHALTKLKLMHDVESNPGPSPDCLLAFVPCHSVDS